MRIGIAQINAFLGDFKGNREKILSTTHRALERRCDLLVFPEAALFGYHPVDLLERPSVVEAQLKELKNLHNKMPKGISILVGAITKNTKTFGKPYFNSAVLLEKGKKPKVFAKQLLPTYDVFDEGRHIEPGDMRENIFKFKGKNVLVTICEDIWAWPSKDFPKFSQYSKNPLLQIPVKSVDLVLNLSASPFTETKEKHRIRVVTKTAKRFKSPMIYVNLVGAQDELIYDGGSFAVDKNGKILAQSLSFEEDFNFVDFKKNEGGIRKNPKDHTERRRRALVLGLRDFVSKVGFSKVHLGLSGGIDSALVACLAADALGPQNVKCFALPTEFNSEESSKWALELAENVGFSYSEHSIQNSFKNFSKELDQAFGPLAFSLLHENLQSRLRGMFLMAYANFEKSLLLGTSNKSELAMGYSTLYGDLCGALLPIGDLLKTEVYDLAKHYNKESEVIPKGIILRPPSAELRPNQKDEDSLPPYSQLDPAVEKLVEGYSSAKGALEERVLKSLMGSEFKRWQAPPILKVSDHAFGRGRRLPLAHKAFF